MFKLIFCARRQHHLTRAQFQDYWLHHHGPLFMQHATTYRARRYVQNHTLDTPLNEAIRAVRGMGVDIDEYDGVGELCWESEADFLAVVRSPEGERLREIFIEDEGRFVDQARSTAFFVREEALLPSATP